MFEVDVKNMTEKGRRREGEEDQLGFGGSDVLTFYNKDVVHMETSNPHPPCDQRPPFETFCGPFPLVREIFYFLVVCENLWTPVLRRFELGQYLYWW